tara:strand:- start:1544 stop:2176 length:633 start_codon:yes stop_codon:yes gene_type:complete
MSNVINSGSIDTLQPNETLLTRILTTSSDKVQLEFAEAIQNPNYAESSVGINLLYLANKSDSRFSRKVQYGWLTGTPEDVYPLFGITPPTDAAWLTDERGKNYVQLDMVNPEIIGHATADGEAVRARVQIVESVMPNSYQAEDIETRCKTRGKGGEAILHNGQRVFVTRNVLPCAGDTAAASEFLKSDPAGIPMHTAVLSPFADVAGIEL